MSAAFGLLNRLPPTLRQWPSIGSFFQAFLGPIPAWAYTGFGLYGLQPIQLWADLVFGGTGAGTSTKVRRDPSPRSRRGHMITQSITQANIDTLVTVFGGSGFLGRHVVRALCKRGYRVRIAVRRPELAGHLQPTGKVGQIHAVQTNLRYPASVEAAMRGSSVAINLVGILVEGGARTF